MGEGDEGGKLNLTTDTNTSYRSLDTTPNSRCSVSQSQESPSGRTAPYGVPQGHGFLGNVIWGAGHEAEAAHLKVEEGVPLDVIPP